VCYPLLLQPLLHHLLHLIHLLQLFVVYCCVLSSSSSILHHLHHPLLHHLLQHLLQLFVVYCCVLSVLITNKKNDDVVCGAVRKSCPSWMQGPTERANGKGVSSESPPMG
jgi:hypothetical protein